MPTFPRPRPWPHRASAMPWVPGTVGQAVAHVTALLESVDREPYLDRPFVWHLTGAETTIRQALRGLGASGLVEQDDGVARLTPEARTFLDTNDSAHLLSVFHAHVRFVGEAIHALDTPLTHEELNEVARTDYQMAWTSLDQIRRRTAWARAAGIVELWRSGNKLVLTDKGREFRSLVEIAAPGDLPQPTAATAELPTAAGPEITALMAALDATALAARKGAIGYIPGNGVHDSLRDLVNIASPSITHRAFHRRCVERFGIADASAKQTLVSLRSLGLLEQTALDSVSPSKACQEWIASGEPADLVRIVHGKAALVGEVLQALSPTEQIDTTAVYAWLTGRYGGTAMTRGELTTRLVLLRECGLVERITHLTYRLTPRGLAFRDSIPLQRPEPAADGVEPSEVETFAGVLVAASSQKDPGRFEKLTAEAFVRLGADVEYVADEVHPAFVATFWLSPSRRARLLVAARSEPAGALGEAFVLGTLDQCRRRHDAAQAAIVAPGFAEGLASRAADKGILAVTVHDLAQLVARYATTPVRPARVLELLGRSDPGPIWAVAERPLDVFTRVAETLWTSGNDPEEVEHGDGTLTVKEIWRATRQGLGTRIDIDDVVPALRLLTDPHVQGAVQHSDDVFGAACHPRQAAAHLRALADRLDAIASPPEPPTRAPRLVPKQRGPAAATAGEIRAWALAKGYRVGRLGKLPRSVVEDFHARHSPTKPAGP